eukprot:GHUV01011705.1.p1 GENE.GHUV01011705.1~~GHUV01011705.1.p1  ORF type:complete len:284 (+),score=61.15 GHUV01011705.1:524-1375(+)
MSINSSRTIEASKMKREQVDVLRRVLRVYTCSYDDTDAADVMHRHSVDAEFEWDESYESSQRDLYVSAIKESLTPRLCNKLAWKDQIKVKMLLRGVGHTIASKNDELLFDGKWINDAQAGSAIGIELKKRLTDASRRQAETEFYAFSITSHLPFLQLVTDMQRGGFAYYKSGDMNGQQVVVERVLKGMDTFYEFLREALSALPTHLTNAHAEIAPVEKLENPGRYKLYEPALLQAAASVFDEPDCGDDCLDDLNPWFSSKQQLVATGDLPDAIAVSDQSAVNV